MLSDLLILLPVLVVAAALVLLRRRQKTVPEEKPPENAIVVDGSNVMHWDGEPSAQVLRSILRSLERAGFAPILFFDANVGHKLSDRYFDEAALAKITGVPVEHICVVHSGVVADEGLLAFARDHGLRVVSNDQFRDWRVQFPFLGERGRTLRGTFRDGTVIWRGKL